MGLPFFLSPFGGFRYSVIPMLAFCSTRSRLAGLLRRCGQLRVFAIWHIFSTRGNASTCSHAATNARLSTIVFFMKIVNCIYKIISEHYCECNDCSADDAQQDGTTPVQGDPILDNVVIFTGVAPHQQCGTPQDVQIWDAPEKYANSRLSKGGIIFHKFSLSLGLVFIPMSALWFIIVPTWDQQWRTDVHTAIFLCMIITWWLQYISTVLLFCVMHFEQPKAGHCNRLVYNFKQLPRRMQYFIVLYTIWSFMLPLCAIINMIDMSVWMSEHDIKDNVYLQKMAPGSGPSGDTLVNLRRLHATASIFGYESFLPGWFMAIFDYGWFVFFSFQTEFLPWVRPYDFPTKVYLSQHRVVNHKVVSKWDPGAWKRWHHGGLRCAALPSIWAPSLRELHL